MDRDEWRNIELIDGCPKITIGLGIVSLLDS
jgi:hypothetical protein